MTNPTLSYKNIPLLIPSVALVEQIEKDLPLDAWLLGSAAKINRLHYPSDASRFAYFYFLATKEDEAKFRPSNSGTSHDLKMDEVIAKMFYLGSRLIYDTSEKPLHLCCLVDERYWAIKRGAEIGLSSFDDEEPSEWSELFDGLKESAELLVSVDSVASDYLYPDSDNVTLWKGRVGASACELLDLTCRNVGQVFSGNLTVSFKSKNIEDAIEIVENNLANAWPIRAGAKAQHEKALPNYLTVHFPKFDTEKNQFFRDITETGAIQSQMYPAPLSYGLTWKNEGAITDGDEKGHHLS